MKRKAHGKVKGESEKLKRMKLDVEKFIQNTEVSDTNEQHYNSTEKRKSRKEVRKEKRKRKKLKKKEYYERRHLNPDLPVRKQQNNTPAKNNSKKNSLNATVKAGVVVKTDKPAEKGGSDQKKPSTKKGSKKKTREDTRKRSLLEANVEEEKEIKRLEKYLGLNKRKNKNTLPQTFCTDGLDYILGVLEPGGSVSGLYDSDDEMDAKQKMQQLKDSSSDQSESDKEAEEDEASKSDLGTGDEEEGENENLEMIEEEEMDNDDDDVEQEVVEGSCEGSDDTHEEGKEDHIDQELGSNESSTPGRYIPPNLRESTSTVDSKKMEELDRLKKNVKGLVNRLSEPNMASISGQLEELYMANSRKDMNETLTDILLTACVTPARMPDRLMMEHILLVSILHRTVGIEVGAHFLEAIVKRFDEMYRAGSGEKEMDNLIALIAHMYNFHVIRSLLVFDILRKLTCVFAEKDIELILFLLKNVGFSLRKDDALALKEFISEAQSKATSVGKNFEDQSRVRFMLETMLALKNNDMRKIPGYDPEPIERLRKLQRTLVHNSGSGSDTQLRVSLENLLAADQVGRWWIVGSSWSGAPMIGNTGSKEAQTLPVGEVSAKIMELARKQRMNTDIRKNIFCVMMTSEDFLDAFEKLLRLGLKGQQEREIIHVLIDCCLQEKIFNPFYAFLGEKFCEYDRRFQMTFQFSMWDKFRDLGSLTSTAFANLVLLLTHLLKRRSLSLSVFKVIEFSELDKPRVRLLRQVLQKLLMETDTEELTDIFGRISGIPKLGMLREGLKLFISHFLLKNTSKFRSAEEASILKEHADIAAKALQAKESQLRL
ncbi:nucleolar MIF4G domain-containing protein 1 [Latimeria chalumnae]|uniref:Nucleolar MIF4G domain-containing protein 1 n=1 Tax=Latimeria chalumnae TaxID=7897 RepID=H3AUQ6_LATCH|nr:PREDICTED: nucleolar MIF4G domain-containing protein 1 [Latimeria chalumnae]|eukprot:XP_006002233.1 PREDICTED: nucleolar MIF4G domain-containing protein 1 [Latimeria chalumnae]